MDTAPLKNFAPALLVYCIMIIQSIKSRLRYFVNVDVHSCELVMGVYVSGEPKKKLYDSNTCVRTYIRSM